MLVTFLSLLLQSFSVTATSTTAHTADFLHVPHSPILPVKECEAKKIAILDLNDLAQVGGFPRCDLHTALQVNRALGIVYSMKHDIPNASPHMFGTHAAPWFLYEAIKASQYYTQNLDDADLILVYDYCHYMSWLAAVHSGDSVDPFDDAEHVSGDHLVQAYRTMVKLEQWRKSNGSQFIFYDSHPGFTGGKAGSIVRDMKCDTFRNAIQLIMDTPMRNLCEGFWLLKKLIVTPYAPSLIDTKDARYYLDQKFVGVTERPILAYSRHSCAARQDPGGKQMRYWLSFIEWGSNLEMDVRCTDTELSSEGHLDFKDMYAKMRSAKFCIALPGDSASTRRLSEIFLAGCIPVFLGPPYHSMPFGDTVPYAELAVFFHIKNNSMWTEPGPTEWKLHPTIRSDSAQESRWWVPDVDIPRSEFIEVNQPWEIEGHLKSMPANEVSRMLKLMHLYGKRFSFLQRISDPPNAINSLLSAICKKQNLFPVPPG